MALLILLCFEEKKFCLNILASFTSLISYIYKRKALTSFLFKIVNDEGIAFNVYNMLVDELKLSVSVFS